MNLPRSLLAAFLRLFVNNEQTSLPLPVHTVKKILVLRYDKLGDMVVTTPMLRLLQERLPHAELHVLASPRNAALLAHDTTITTTHVWDGSWQALMRLARTLRRERFDLVFCTVFYKMTTMGAVTNLLVGRKPCKITLREQRADKYAVWFNAQIPLEREQPMSALLVQLVCAAFGWPYTPAMTRFHVVTAEAHRTAAQHWFEHEVGANECVLYNLSAGAPYRQWSFERHEAFLRAFSAAFPALQIVINATGSERPSAERLAALFHAVRVLPATEDIVQLCAYVACVDAVITPDTSITHIANAAHKPLVVMCTQLSGGAQWLPFGVPYRAVLADGDAPVESIRPEQVMAAFAELYQHYHAQHKGREQHEQQPSSYAP
jgi:ADP-heptose:LPS heptosyltransferase